MEKKQSLLERASRLLDVPGDVLAGLPRLVLNEGGELRMRPRQGVLDYGPEEIHTPAGKLLVMVKGEGLELRAMNPTQLLITGRITAVELTR